MECHVVLGGVCCNETPAKCEPAFSIFATVYSLSCRGNNLVAADSRQWGPPRTHFRAVSQTNYKYNRYINRRTLSISFVKDKASVETS